MRVGKADGQHGVGAKSGLVGRAIKINHEPINGGLIKRVETLEGGGYFCVDMIYRIGHALAAIVFFVAIAKFNRLMFTGAGARWNSGATHSAICKSDLTFHGGETP